MRFCRFGDGRVGLVEDSNVRDVTPALDVLPVYRYPLPPHDVFIANLDRVAERARALAGTCPQLPVAGSLRKSADSYAVLGPWLVTADEIPNPDDLDLKIAVNGEERQNSNTKYMILGVARLIEFASAFYTLNPGDVVMTGTPEGVSPIQPGDTIVATIEKIGTMEVEVRAA